MLVLNSFKLISGTFTRNWLVEGGIQKNFQKSENCQPLNCPSSVHFSLCYHKCLLKIQFNGLCHIHTRLFTQRNLIYSKSTNKRQVNMILSRPRINASKLLERNLFLVGSHKKGIHHNAVLLQRAS